MCHPKNPNLSQSQWRRIETEISKKVNNKRINPYTLANASTYIRIHESGCPTLMPSRTSKQSTIRSQPVPSEISHSQYKLAVQSSWSIKYNNDPPSTPEHAINANPCLSAVHSIRHFDPPPSLRAPLASGHQSRLFRSLSQGCVALARPCAKSSCHSGCTGTASPRGESAYAASSHGCG